MRVCGAWDFDIIEVTTIKWDAITNTFTVYGTTACNKCGAPGIESSRWWKKWKTIPAAIMKDAECPLCHSKESDKQKIFKQQKSKTM